MWRVQHHPARASMLFRSAAVRVLELTHVPGPMSAPGSRHWGCVVEPPLCSSNRLPVTAPAFGCGTCNSSNNRSTLKHPPWHPWNPCTGLCSRADSCCPTNRCHSSCSSSIQPRLVYVVGLGLVCHRHQHGVRRPATASPWSLQSTPTQHQLVVQAAALDRVHQRNQHRRGYHEGSRCSRLCQHNRLQPREGARPNCSLRNCRRNSHCAATACVFVHQAAHWPSAFVDAPFASGCRASASWPYAVQQLTGTAKLNEFNQPPMQRAVGSCTSNLRDGVRGLLWKGTRQVILAHSFR